MLLPCITWNFRAIGNILGNSYLCIHINKVKILILMGYKILAKDKKYE